MLSWDELIAGLTEAQAKALIYAIFASVGVTTTNWKPNGTLRTVIAVIAIILSGLTQALSLITQGTILETASGLRLTLLARYVYGIQRREATFAENAVKLTNAGGFFLLGPGELIVRNAATGVVYENLEQLEMGTPGVYLPVVRARVVGSAGTALPGQITEFETPLLGVTVTNDEPLLGTDEQRDDELKTDCALARAALSPLGTEGVYEFFSKYERAGLSITEPAAPLTRGDGTAIGVNRAKAVVTSTAPTVITTYVATASGDVAGDTMTPGTDLYLVDQNIKRRATPLGITELTVNAPSVPITVEYQVVADPAYGSSAVEVKTAIDSAIALLGATYPLGGQTENGVNYFAFRGPIRGAIQESHPAIVNARLITPILDALMTPGSRADLSIDPASYVILVQQ